MTETKKTATAAKTTKKAAPAKSAAKKAPVANVKLTNATYATGKRKDSVARVYLVPGKGNIYVNETPAAEDFGLPVHNATAHTMFMHLFWAVVCPARRAR